MGEFYLKILTKGMSLEPLNSTNIMLIPKVSQPMNLTNFKLISLCNVLYKIVSKTIANRLRHVLDICIDKAQSAFVSGGLIIDNVLLAYEVLHAYKQKRLGQKAFLALKPDMSGFSSPY